MNKLQRSLLILLLLIAVVFYSCVDEPTLEQIKRPYSVVRIGNFSYNVDQITVRMDGNTVATLAKNSVMPNYIDVQSGKREFVVTDGAGTEIYRGNLDIVSYDEVALYFTGYSAPTVDTLNSFSPLILSEGTVYLDESPASDEVFLRIYNLAPDLPTENSIKYYIRCIDDSTITLPEVEYNNGVGLIRPVGDKTIAVLQQTVGGLAPQYKTLADTTDSFQGGKIYYWFITQNPSAPVLVKDVQNPQPVRPK